METLIYNLIIIEAAFTCLERRKDMRNVVESNAVRQASGILAFASRLAFALTVILMPVRARMVLWARPLPPIYRDYTDYLLYAADAALLLTLAFWLASLLLSPRKIAFGPRHIWIPLTVLTLAGWLSIVTSADPLLSGYHGIRLLVLFWFYVYFINEIHSFRWVTIPVLSGAAIQAIVAVAQFAAQRSLGLQWLGELALDPAWAGVSIVDANGVRLLRAYGLTDHPNILGGSLAFAAILLLAVSGRIPQRMIALAALLPGLLVSFSRSGWIAFAGGAAFLIWAAVIRRDRGALRGWLAFTLMGMVLVAPFVLAYARFFGVRLGADRSFTTPTAEAQALGARWILVSNAIPLIASHPLLGVGLGASPLALHAAHPESTVTLEPPHVTLLDATLETGVGGGAAYLALMILPVAMFYVNRESALQNPAALGAIGLLLALLIVGLFDYYPWMLNTGRLWQWLAWGLWGNAYQGKLEARSER